MSTLTFRASSFRAVRELAWRPEGVCLLSGPNGAGKTTTLDVMRFLRAMMEWGYESAFQAVDADHLRHLEAAEGAPVMLEVEVGELLWRLELPMSDAGLKAYVGEELFRGGRRVLRAGMVEDVWHLGDERLPRDEKRCCARLLWDRGDAAWMEPLYAALTSVRVYGSYWLNQVRRPEVFETFAAFLHGSGKNLWSVLANWKSAPLRYRGQFDWVMEHARRAFPEVVGSLEFDRGQAFLFRPAANDPADGLPPRRAADGLLTGLLHLTAVAGAKDGSILAFDEMENQLHPHAIRVLIQAMRERAAERELTIVLTTHSPVVMNEFKGEEERFFVLDGASVTPQPRTLLDLHGEAWLSHFALGDLYERDAFAAQGRAG